MSLLTAETFNTHLGILNPYFCDKINKGFFMKGSIFPETRAACSCGSSYVQVEECGFSIPKCIKCKTNPDKLRIKKYLPSLTGYRGEWVEIRYDKRGERLTQVWQAMATLNEINNEVKDKTFDPRAYKSQKNLSQYSFSTFFEKMYLDKINKEFNRKEISSETIKKKKGYFKNHIKKFFNDVDIRTIKTATIFQFYNSWDKATRQRELVMGELRVILTYAYDLEIIPKLPKFPKLKQASFRDAENIISIGEFYRALDCIENPMCRKMIELLSIYALRPCEVRALQWGDIDLDKGILYIKRHFSGSTLTDYRKSNKTIHKLPLTKIAIDIFNSQPKGFRKDQFIFLGKRGGALSAKVLRNSWYRSLEIAGIKKVDLYEGTKHTRLSYLKNEGNFSDEELILLSGHTNTKTMKRYALKKESKKRETVEKLLDFGRAK